MPDFLLALVLILWTGLLLGISFLATSVKFRAPHLTLPVAMEVGKVTFHLFNRIEWGILFLILLCTFFVPLFWGYWGIAIILSLLLSIETFWLLPVLDHRTDKIIAGGSVPPGIFHKVFVWTSILKVLFSLGGGVWVLQRVCT